MPGNRLTGSREDRNILNKERIKHDGCITISLAEYASHRVPICVLADSKSPYAIPFTVQRAIHLPPASQPNFWNPVVRTPPHSQRPNPDRNGLTMRTTRAPPTPPCTSVPIGLGCESDLADWVALPEDVAEQSHLKDGEMGTLLSLRMVLHEMCWSVAIRGQISL
ncbi:unnamed protein product [Mycena citricolor]|uniref:Uncharacterized protein n=1 Tax=Mycena citricolor TaxID=2018698 RepID=A0AAD2HEF8_9AGAR|nr:unnamed protein product [Mycena citricolor]